MLRAGDMYNIRREDELTLAQVPLELLNSGTVRKLLKLQYRKALGDTALSKMTTAAAKEKWMEVRYRPTYSTRDFLIVEKKHDAALVEQVIQEESESASSVAIATAARDPTDDDRASIHHGPPPTGAVPPAPVLHQPLQAEPDGRGEQHKDAEEMNGTWNG